MDQAVDPDYLTELPALYEISSIPASLVSHEQLGKLVLEKATRLLGVPIALLYWWKRESHLLNLWAARGISEAGVQNMLVESSALASLATRDQHLLMDSPQAIQTLGALPFQDSVHYGLCLPIHGRDQPVALLCVFRLAARSFTRSDLALLSVLVDRAATALENIRLFTEAEERYHALEHEIAERQRVEQEREAVIAELQAALEKIKTLKGLIPICANCKRIRDDQGYWHQVEAYVRSHSEAEFSHSICPECARLLYPGYYEENMAANTRCREEEEE